MKFHLRFRHINATVVRAADELFAAGPWTGETDHKYEIFNRWLRRASDAYGVPAPTLEIHEADRALAQTGVQYEIGQITMAAFSVINLFHGFRHHLQHLGYISFNGEEWEQAELAELDAVGWACSLFYTSRPRSFRKAVREGKILYVRPEDLLTEESLARLQEEREAEWEARQTAYNMGEDDESPYSENHPAPVAHAGSLSTTEAAAILQVSTSRVLQMTQELGGHQTGRRWSFSRELVLAEAAMRGLTGEA